MSIQCIAQRLKKVQDKNQCTKDKAVLLMIKSRELQGSFSTKSISILLGIPVHKVELVFGTAMFKMRDTIKHLKNKEDLKDSLLHLEGR